MNEQICDEIIDYIENKNQILEDIVRNMYDCLGEMQGSIETIRYFNYLYRKFKNID